MQFSKAIILKIALMHFILLVNIECLNDCRRFRRNAMQHQCELTPQSVEGPFYVDKKIIRQDVREYRPGIAFNMILYFTDANSCKPLPGLWITIWSCDAIGYYSAYTKIDVTVPYGSLDHGKETDNSTFLRGAQQTDQDGKVQFLTVLPGWYANRTHHIHFHVYHKDLAIFTAQLYFTEQMSSWMYGTFPYYAQIRYTNSYDFMFTDYGGKQTTLRDIRPVNIKRWTDGFVGKMVIGLNFKANPSYGG